MRDPALASAALGIFLRALFAFHRRRARTAGLPGDGGAVTFLQRFGSALQVNLHCHARVPDGVFGESRFHELDPPDDQEVAALLATVAARVLRLLRRKGRLEEEPEVDELPFQQAAHKPQIEGDPLGKEGREARLSQGGQKAGKVGEEPRMRGRVVDLEPVYGDL